ncbi:MAG: DUF72 domain-containing protein [Proteobacteria bacterium]|nr:DUF72 domain-containing protein [Pseudomonadota bacterium]MBU2452910.1 DUF72 domain-containing protein [Pseudomonadota bacterium]MBU2627500.1 DUF72 domain-containing protein [Pseudomonadota bacterium]
MKRLPQNIRIGTCSWKYDSWKGLLYSDDVGKNYLSEYSKHFSIVEVDQWFWGLFGDKIVMPKPEVVSEYVASVPKDFRFSIKVPNAITLTHKHGKGPLEANPHFLSNELMEDFIELLEPMSKQINSLIFQFEYLNKQKMPDQLTFQNQLEAFCQKLPPKFHYCIEIRNQNYLNKPYFEFLESMKLSHVFLQGYWMPPIFEIYRRFQEYIKRHTVIRLHGPDRKGIEHQTDNKWNAIVDPKDGELHKLKIMIHDLLAREVKVTLSVNNHYEGSAPRTIDRLLNLF